MNLNSKEPIYYIYRHVRHDKNEVFYIGIGKLNQKGIYLRTKYKRAFCKKKNGRNRYWLYVIGSTDYSVEILFHTKDFKLALSKEIEFIKLYGRKDLSEGTLVNLTDGADCPYNVVVSDSQRENMSKNSWVKGKTGYKHHRSLPVFVYDSSGKFIGDFGSQRQAGVSLGISNKAVLLSLKGESRHSSGFRFFREYMGENIEQIDLTNLQCKSVECFNENREYVKTFKSITEASKFAKSSTTGISRSARNLFKYTCKGYY
jgi:hypothetical protein